MYKRQVVAAVILIAGWLVYRGKSHPQSTQVADTKASSPAAPQANDSAGRSASVLPATANNAPLPTIPEPPKATPAKKSTKPSTRSDSAPADSAAGAATDALTPAPAPATPAPARVDFDPATLKPSESAKIRIEADHLPASLGFTIEMDGKIYFERGVKSQNTFDNLYAPPGIHEFRVVAGLGSTHKTSNIVSTDFRAKKKKTLRIELREKSSPNVPQSLTPDTQLVLTLK